MVLAVLLGHALLLGGALRLAVWRDRQAPPREAAPLQVVLLRPPPPTATRPPENAAPPRTARRATQAITPVPPEPVPAATPAAADPVPLAAESPASSPPAPLDLRLPRRQPGVATTRQPALDDPRANTPQTTMEERLSAAMGGDGRWVMERLDGDRIRYRRGNDCVEVQRSRAGQLELANGAFRNLWGAKPC